MINIQYVDLLEVLTYNRTSKSCSNHSAVGRQSCEVEKEMADIMEYHICSEFLVTFLVFASTGLSFGYPVKKVN